MKTYVVAVSGGVDSVALLHRLVRQGGMRLVVAHFDHGIRDDSAEDAKFVAELAKTYNLTFETKREELGLHASEALARERRYIFLRDVATQYDNAVIVTAHHANDVVETIAINLRRGTGWRGLAVLDSDLLRPLLGVTKSDILSYATKHRLSWREDSTNQDITYLRNELRGRIATQLSEDDSLQLRALWQTQLQLKKEIDQEVERLLAESDHNYSRHFFTSINTTSALELLRAACQREIGLSPTLPQRERALHAIKTLQPGKICEVGDGIRLICKLRTFSIQNS